MFLLDFLDYVYLSFVGTSSLPFSGESVVEVGTVGSVIPSDVEECASQRKNRHFFWAHV